MSSIVQSPSLRPTGSTVNAIINGGAYSFRAGCGGVEDLPLEEAGDLLVTGRGECVILNASCHATHIVKEHFMTTHWIPRKCKTWFRCITVLSVFFVSQLPAQESIVPYTPEQLAQVQRNLTPKFVPGSDKILYINDASGTLELYEMSTAGKPRQLSSLFQRIRDLVVSLDGSFAVFTADSGGNECFDIFHCDIRSGSVTQLTRTSNISELDLRISPDGTRLAIAADPDVQFRGQIYVLEIGSGIRTQLTRGDIPAWQPRWSHNGKVIAAARSGDGQHGDLLLVNIDNKKVEAISAPTDGHFLVPLDFSPDDQFVLCLTKNKDGFDQLALYDVRTKNVRRIGAGRWDVIEAVWNAQAGILFTRNVSGRTALYRMKTPEEAPDEILAPSGLISGIDVNREGTLIAYIKEDATQPKEVFLLELANGKTNQLTKTTPAYVDSRRLSPAEPFAVKSFDGTMIEGFTYRPWPSSKPPYPAVAYAHGGPNLQSSDNFNSYIQSLTQAGFMVVSINYRGSTGYGKAFEDLNNKDWGGGDRKDIRTVLEHLVSKGIIDRNRIGITGGSYGGYLTLMALVKDPDFYAAGVESFGMFDLIADYEFGKDRFGMWYETEMGNPRTDSALFADRSPVHFLRQLKAPLMVFQGANDSNVPKKLSDNLVETLRSMDRKIEYVVYPDEGHGFTRRANRIDYMKRMVLFFQHHLAAE